MKKIPLIFIIANLTFGYLFSQEKDNSFIETFDSTKERISKVGFNIQKSKIINSSSFKGFEDSGGTLFIPSGVYILNSKLIIPPHTTIVGAGPATTIEVSTSGGFIMEYGSYWEIKNLKIVGEQSVEKAYQKAKEDGTGKYDEDFIVHSEPAFFIDRATNIRFKNVYFHNLSDCIYVTKYDKHSLGALVERNTPGFDKQLYFITYKERLEQWKNLAEGFGMGFYKPDDPWYPGGYVGGVRNPNYTRAYDMSNIVIENCRFKDVLRGIIHYGRGTVIKDTFFYHCLNAYTRHPEGDSAWGRSIHEENFSLKRSFLTKIFLQQRGSSFGATILLTENYYRDIDITFANHEQAKANGPNIFSTVFLRTEMVPVVKSHMPLRRYLDGTRIRYINTGGINFNYCYFYNKEVVFDVTNPENQASGDIFIMNGSYFDQSKFSIALPKKTLVIFQDNFNQREIRNPNLITLE